MGQWVSSCSWAEQVNWLQVQQDSLLLVLNQANLIPIYPGWTGYCLWSVNDQVCLFYSLLKRSVFIPVQKKGNAKECSNYCTVALISQVSKVMLKIFQAGFNSIWIVNFQMFKLDLEKAEEPEMKLPISVGSLKKQESSRKTCSSASLTMPKPLTVWITSNCVKLLKRWEYQTTALPPEKSVCRSRSNN